MPSYSQERRSHGRDVEWTAGKQPSNPVPGTWSQTLAYRSLPVRHFCDRRIFRAKLALTITYAGPPACTALFGVRFFDYSERLLTNPRRQNNVVNASERRALFSYSSFVPAHSFIWTGILLRSYIAFRLVARLCVEFPAAKQANCWGSASALSDKNIGSIYPFKLP